MQLECTSCIKVPESLAGEFWLSDILKYLTRTSRDFVNPDNINVSYYYERRNGYYMIPRFMDINTCFHTIHENYPVGEDININFKTEWRNDLQRQGFQFFMDRKNGILKLPPGEGKTVITIGAICAIKKKAIVFVHKDSLAVQWRDRFLQHTDISNDDIALLSTSGRLEDLQKPIVISTVQTMNSMIDRVPDIVELLWNANFGFAVWDECHTTSGAEKYSRSSLYLPCSRVYGLSATPARADKNHDIIGKHLGPVITPQGITATLAPKIRVLKFGHGVMADPGKRYYVFNGFPNKDGTKPPVRFDMMRYEQMLCAKTNKKYITYLQKILMKCYLANRNILLISNRIKILDAVSTIIPNKNDVGFFIPRSGKLRDSELLKRVVLSTPGSSRDGTDKPKFDCLIMANPIGNIEQAIGRVCRVYEGKPQPVVFDIVDTDYEDFVRSYNRRKDYYEKKGWDLVEKQL